MEDEEGYTSAERQEILKGISVSRLTKDDMTVLPEYVSLLREGIKDIPMSEEEKQKSLARNTIETYTERLSKKDEYFLYVARGPNNEIVGASYGKIRSRADVSEEFRTVGHFGLTVVRSDQRGKRIGERLKDAFEQDCARREVPTMTTFIEDANEASIAINKRMGYREVTDPAFPPQDGGRYYYKSTPPIRSN